MVCKASFNALSPLHESVEVLFQRNLQLLHSSVTHILPPPPPPAILIKGVVPGLDVSSSISVPLKN